MPALAARLNIDAVSVDDRARTDDTAASAAARSATTRTSSEAGTTVAGAMATVGDAANADREAVDVDSSTKHQASRRWADNGAPLFEPTTFTSEDGRIENRFQCEFFPDHSDDNSVSVDVNVPEEGGMVTSDCGRFLIGDKRNCGFSRQNVSPQSCTPGESITVTCSGGSDDVPAVVRMCEASQREGGIPCVYRDALSSAVVGTAAAAVTFVCPAARETPATDAEVGGLFSTFVAPVVPGDVVDAVVCSVVP